MKCKTLKQIIQPSILNLHRYGFGSQRRPDHVSLNKHIAVDNFCSIPLLLSFDSDVRHPRCVSYNSKGLRMEYAQSNTTIF